MTVFYTRKSSAVRGAERLGIINPVIYIAEDGRFYIANADAEPDFPMPQAGQTEAEYCEMLTGRFETEPLATLCAPVKRKPRKARKPSDTAQTANRRDLAGHFHYVTQRGRPGHGVRV